MDRDSIVWRGHGCPPSSCWRPSASQCTPSQPASRRAAGGAQSDVAVAAQKTYVAPGRPRRVLHVLVGRPLRTDLRLRPARRCGTSRPSRCSRPTRRPATASTTTRKKMLGELTWGDAHHPALSETKGDYDGRWLFINEMNGRIARIDLRDFKTKQILGPVPNLHGNHASSFVTPNTEYAMMASRFSRPVPNRPVGVDKYATEYKGIIAGVKIDPTSGEMSLGVADPDAAVRLRPRRRRQAGLRRLDVLHLVQHRARHRQARGHRLAARPRLHRRGRLARRREGHRRRQGRHHRRRQGARSEEGAGHRLPAALRQVAARRRRRARRQVDRRLGQAAGRDHRLQLREDPDRDPATRTSPARKTASRC